MRNEGGGIVEIALLGVDEAIVLTSLPRRAAPVATLRWLGGVRAMAASARAGRPT